jgi:hypothetical protein
LEGIPSKNLLGLLRGNKLSRCEEDLHFLGLYNETFIGKFLFKASI